MLALSVIVNIILVGMLAISNNKEKILDDENIKLRLENNIAKTEIKDLRQQVKSYTDCFELYEPFWQC